MDKQIIRNELAPSSEVTIEVGANGKLRASVKAVRARMEDAVEASAKALRRLEEEFPGLLESAK